MSRKEKRAIVINSNTRIYHWDYLYYLNQEVQLGFDSLSSILKNNLACLIEEEFKLKERLRSDDLLYSLNENDRNSYLLQNYELDNQFIAELTQQQFYASFLSCYAFFEGRLRVLCVELQNHLSPNIFLKDLSSRNHINQYLTFLEKVIGISALRLSLEIKTISGLGTVRNKLAHQNGLISIGEKEHLTKCDILGINFIEVGSQWIIDLSKFDFQKQLIEHFRQLLLDTIATVDDTLKSNS